MLILWHSTCGGGGEMQLLLSGEIVIGLSDALRLRHAFHHISLLACVGQTPHHCAWVVLDEGRVVHVELLYYVTAWPGEYFCGHDVLPVHIVVV